MLDRILDLFVGFQKPDGTDETKLWNVINNNMSSKIIIEFFVGFGPYLLNINEMHTLAYLGFKLFRFGRLAEMDNQINEILE